jgi:Predicted membrane protein
MIFIPVPVMMKYMLTGRNAYRGILEGSLSAMTGVALVFLVFWTMTGATFFDVLSSSLNQIKVEDMNLSAYYAAGMKSLQPDTMQLALDNMKEMTKLAVPGTLIVFCLIIAYLNYALLSWILTKSGKRISALPPFRVFSLPKNIVIGSLIIYLLSYVTANMGIIDKNLMMFNLELLFTFVFSIQGLAVIFYFGYLKKIPKIILLILSAIFLLTWLGQTFLFLLGLTDLVLDIRRRFAQTGKL